MLKHVIQIVFITHLTHANSGEHVSFTLQCTQHSKDTYTNSHIHMHSVDVWWI